MKKPAAALLIFIASVACSNTASAGTGCRQLKSQITKAFNAGKRINKTKVKLYQKSCNKSFRLTGLAMPKPQVDPATDIKDTGTKCIKPEVKLIYCTAVYKPVARIFSDGTCRTYSSECFAKQDFSCTESKLVPGTCESNGYKSTYTR